MQAQILGSRMHVDSRPDLLLIHPPYHRRKGSGRVFPIGLGYLAATAERSGFATGIVDCAPHFGLTSAASLSELRLWLSAKLRSCAPRLAIGIGPCTTSAVRGVKAVAQACHETMPNIPIIFGGPLASIPDQSQLFFDEFKATAVVPGDGELAICAFLYALKAGKGLESIDGITTSPDREAHPNVVMGLDSLPFPRRNADTNGVPYSLSVRRDLFAGPFATIITSRGCPHRCTFCMSRYLRAGQYSRRSLDNVMKEVNDLNTTYGINSLVFYDDTFFQNARTLEKEVTVICSNMLDLDTPIQWQAEIRPDVLVAIDSKVARQLFTAGCRQLNVGIEKANSAETTSLGKPIDITAVRTAAKEIAKGAPGMRLTATFIFGGPHETKDDLHASVELSKSIGLLFAHFYPMETYPGTELYKKCFPHDGPLDWYDRVMRDPLPWGEIIYETPGLSQDELLSSVAEAYRAFYDRQEWHETARKVLGENYSKVARTVKQWCEDRFGLKETSN